MHKKLQITVTNFCGKRMWHLVVASFSLLVVGTSFSTFFAMPIYSFRRHNMLLLHYLLVRFDRLSALICPGLDVQVQLHRRSCDVCVVGCAWWGVMRCGGVCVVRSDEVWCACAHHSYWSLKWVGWILRNKYELIALLAAMHWAALTPRWESSPLFTNI